MRVWVLSLHRRKERENKGRAYPAADPGMELGGAAEQWNL